MVSEERIEKLKEIIREEYRQELTLKEATEVANTLVDWFDLLARIYHETKNSNK
jgi:hypothetical protein